MWGNILVRSWDAVDAGTSCAGQTVPVGFEGLHVFDVSDPAAPQLKQIIDLECGSHTATGVPDRRNGRLLVYSTPSNGNCEGINIVEVPLGAPENVAADRLRGVRSVPAARDRHSRQEQPELRLP